MLLGFKRRFAPYVEDGTKTHTIRGIRKIAPRVGEMCHCYVDPRQKSMKLLGRFPCVKVEQIEIRERKAGPSVFVSVKIDGQHLDQDEKIALARRDGFRGWKPGYEFAEMMEFWRETHGSGGKLIRFKGHVIHWKFAQAVSTSQ